MQDFLSRLVERTLGLGEVVQPVTSPSFVNEIETTNALASSLPQEKKVLSIEELGFSEAQDTSFTKENDLSLPPFKEKTVKYEKSKSTESAVNTQSDLKHDLVTERDQQLKSVSPFHAQRKGRSSSARPGNPEIASGVTSNKAIEKSGSTQPKEPTKVDLSKGKDVHPRISDPEYSPKEGVFKNNEKPSPVIRLPVEKNAGSMECDGAEAYKKERLQRNEDVHTEKAVHSPVLPTLKIPIRPEVSIFKENTARAEAHHRTSEGELSSVPTTIKVTIGRIDVRAVKKHEPSWPLQHKVSSRPKLSLDDYLKQRNRGKQ